MAVYTTVDEKVSARRAFIQSCSPETMHLHGPIIDPRLVNGHLNPRGIHGTVPESEQANPGQSTVFVLRRSDFETMDESGQSPYGGREYAVPGTVESVAVAEKFSKLYHGEGGIILGSGLNAIAALFMAAVTQNKTKKNNPAFLIPDNRYYPADRALTHMKDINHNLAAYHYPSRAGKKELEATFDRAAKDKKKPIMAYAEVIGSQTFEVPKLKKIIRFAEKHDLLTAIDNTYMSYAGFQPLDYGFDYVVEATTKYPGGYADTPSGIVVARTKEGFDYLEKKSRAFGMGAVSPQLCERLSARSETTAERMKMHHERSMKIIKWFEQQPFVADILCPFREGSPDNKRFNKYFEQGNGLFSVVFKKGITKEQVENFLDGLLLCVQGESWGSHITIAQLATPGREIDETPEGIIVRFSMGLEPANDIEKDIAQSAAMHLMAA